MLCTTIYERLCDSLSMNSWHIICSLLLACFNLPSKHFLVFCCPRCLIPYLEWGLRSWESQHEPKCWIEYAQLWSEHHSFSMCLNPKSWMFVLVVNEYFSGSLIGCYFSCLCDPNAHRNPISHFTNKSVWIKYEPQIYMFTTTNIFHPHTKENPTM